MRLSNILVTVLAGAAFTVPIRSEENEVTELDVKSLAFALPQAIQVRVEMTALQRPEFIESNKQSGFEGLREDDCESLENWVRVYRASDGLIFLADDRQMALWVRDKAEWKCVVSSLQVDKTFGGVAPDLPVLYLGNGLFAVSETVPGDVTEKSKEGYPQARAVTFLIDSKDGKVKERSKSFVYDHSPPVVVPKEWSARYKVESEQDGAGQPATRPESTSEGGDKPQPEAEGRSR